MKHGPEMIWDSARFSDAIPDMNSVINKWHDEHEDIEDEMGIVTPQEDVHHECYDDEGGEHDHIMRWSIMRIV